MPNLLNDLINPQYSTAGYPGREQTLQQIAGSGYAGPPTTPQVPMPQPPAQPQTQPWQEMAKESRKKKDLQKAFAEIVETRNRTGKKFLTPTQLLGILTKHVSPQVANQIANQIGTERAKAEQQFKISETGPRGGVTSRLAGRKELEAGIQTKVPKPLTTKEKIQKRIDEEGLTIDTMKPWEKLAYGAKTSEKAGVPEQAKKAMTAAKFAASQLRNIADKDNMMNFFATVDFSKGLEGLDQTEFKTMSDKAMEIIDDPNQSTSNKRAATMYRNNLNTAFELMGGNLKEVKIEPPKAKVDWHKYDVRGGAGGSF